MNKNDLIKQKRLLKNKLFNDVKCPMCGHQNFVLSNKYVVFLNADQIKAANNGISVGMPSVTLVCKNCGYISFHLNQFLEEDVQNKPKTDEEKSETVENK